MPGKSIHIEDSVQLVAITAAKKDIPANFIQLYRNDLSELNDDAINASGQFAVTGEWLTDGNAKNTLAVLTDQSGLNVNTHVRLI